MIPKLSREKMSQLEPSDSESTSPPPHSTSPKRILSISGGARLQQKRVTTTSPSPEDTTFPRKRSISASSNAAPTTPIQLSPRKRDGVSSLEGIAGYNCTLTLKKEDIDKQNPKKPKVLHTTPLHPTQYHPTQHHTSSPDTIPHPLNTTPHYITQHHTTQYRTNSITIG